MKRSLRIVLCFVFFGCCAVPVKSQVVEDKKSAVVPVVQKSPLYRDERLLRKITVKPGTKTVALTAKAILAAAKVRVYTDDLELRTARFTLGCADAKTADLMDAITALWMCRWQKDSTGAYKMLGSKRLLGIYLPKDADRAEIYRQGELFMEQYPTFPAPLREKLQRNESVPLAELPQEALKLTQSMADRLIRAKNAAGHDIALPLESPIKWRMRLRIEEIGGFQRYFITLMHAESGGMGWGFNNYQSKRGEVQKQLEAQGPLHEPRKFEQTQKDARKLPALQQQRITLKGKRMTFPEVLRDLHVRYQISYATDAPDAFLQRADVNFEAVALGEVLDKLTKEVFRETEWEVRPSGFLVIRSPKSPARTETNFDP